MDGTEFLKNCTASSIDCCELIMSGIKTCFPEYYSQMEDRRYELLELMNITEQLGVEWDE